MNGSKARNPQSFFLVKKALLFGAVSFYQFVEKNILSGFIINCSFYDFSEIYNFSKEKKIQSPKVGLFYQKKLWEPLTFEPFIYFLSYSHILSELDETNLMVYKII